MCLSPITIINPCKYVSLKYRERFLIQVPCGQCAQCMTNKSNEWYFRSYYHSLDTLSNGGYIVFDTLTYNNESLPHISDFVVVDNKLDYPCFNAKHIQLFNKRLRRYCDKFNSKYTFFVTSEYGTSEKHTHRPHYHILLYCDGKVDKLIMSKFIADAWQYGRTDGICFKNNNYVLHNIFTADKFSESLRTCRYVSKYVQKSCKFQSEINHRINSIMFNVAKKMRPIGCDEDDYSWLETISAKRYRMKLNRLMNQFHRQSVGFGSSFLGDADINELMRTNAVEMPDSIKVKLQIPLPAYYKRKLFYKVIRVDGNDTWIPTKLGYQYLKIREKVNVKRLVDRFVAANHQYKLDFDVHKLADYVVNVRGRIRAVLRCEDIIDKINSASFFNYVTMSDKEHLCALGLTTRFIGNNTIGYCVDRLPASIRFGDFIARYVMLDDTLEKQLTKLNTLNAQLDDGRQNAFALRQRLTNLYHSLRV